MIYNFFLVKLNGWFLISAFCIRRAITHGFEGWCGFFHVEFSSVVRGIYETKNNNRTLFIHADIITCK